MSGVNLRNWIGQFKIKNLKEFNKHLQIDNDKTLQNGGQSLWSVFFENHSTIQHTYLTIAMELAYQKDQGSNRHSESLVILIF
jgi:hypothetical protein